MYSDVLEKICVLTQKIANEQLNAVVEELKRKLQEKHRFKILVVSDCYGKDAILKIMENIRNSAEDVVDPSIDLIETNDAENLKMLSQEFLKNNNKITYWCAQDIRQLEERIITEYDFLFLFTNATMALSQKEKNWLKEVVNPFFG